MNPTTPSPYYEALDPVGTVILAVGFFVNFVFLFHYAVAAPWWKNPIGRMFILSAFAIACMGCTVLASLLFGPAYPGRYFFRILGYGIFTVAIVNQVVTYFIERHKPNSELPTRHGGNS